MQEAGSRKQEAGGRMQEAGGRRQEAGSRRQDANLESFQSFRLYHLVCKSTIPF